MESLAGKRLHERIVHATIAIPSSIHFISDDGMPNRRQVHPELMRTPGFGKEMEQRKRFRFRNLLVTTQRSASAMNAYGHFFAVDRMAANREFDSS